MPEVNPPDPDCGGHPQPPLTPLRKGGIIPRRSPSHDPCSSTPPAPRPAPSPPAADRTTRRFTGTIFRLRPRVEWMEDRTLPSTFVVSSTADSGPGSLRQAILDSNAATGATTPMRSQRRRRFGGADDLPLLPPAPDREPRVDRWLLRSRGPAARRSSRSTATRPVGATACSSLLPDVTIRGLSMEQLLAKGQPPHAGGRCDQRLSVCLSLGTVPAGTKAGPAQGGYSQSARQPPPGVTKKMPWATRQLSPITLLLRARGDRRSGSERRRDHGRPHGEFVTGEAALDNGSATTNVDGFQIGGGVVIEGGASNDRIGTNGTSVDDAGERNVIAGSGNDGIDISGSGTNDAVVAGNFIGTDATGTRALGIADNGVLIADHAACNHDRRRGHGGRCGGRRGRRDLGHQRRWSPDHRPGEFQCRRR